MILDNDNDWLCIPTCVSVYRCCLLACVCVFPLLSLEDLEVFLCVCVCIDVSHSVSLLLCVRFHRTKRLFDVLIKFVGKYAIEVAGW